MRIVATALLVGTLFTSTCLGQKNETLEQSVSRIVESGAYSGWDDKMLSTQGDLAAVALTKVIKGRSLSVNQIKSVLLVLDLAFMNRAAIHDSSANEPQTALFVLQLLELSSQDPKLKEQVRRTRKNLQGS
jgi:hypothetical protein